MCHQCQLQTISSFFASPVVEVIAGEEGLSLYISIQALKSCDSPLLNSFVDKPWKDADDIKINWRHVESATIIRFFTFLFTGNYVVPASEPVSSGDDPSSNSGKPSCPGYEVEIKASSALPRTAAQSSRLESSSRSQSLIMSGSIDNEQLCARQSSRGTFIPGPYRHTAVLLAHAKVYSFAQRYAALDLKEFSSQQLRQVLELVNFSTHHGVADIIAVTKFVYANIPNQGREKDLAKKMMAHYAASNYSTLVKHAEFNQLLTEIGEFKEDVLSRISRKR